MLLTPGSLLHRIDATLACAGEASSQLRRERVVLDVPQWFERTYRTNEHDFVNSWFEQRATFPPATVAMTFIEVGQTVRWQRGSKHHHRVGMTVVQVTSRDYGLEGSIVDATKGPSVWWQYGKLRSLEPVAGVEVAGTCTIATGAIVPLAREAAGTVAVLFLAKADVRFRRLDYWGIRSDFLAALPAPLARMLWKGFRGELRDLDLQ